MWGIDLKIKVKKVDGKELLDSLVKKVASRKVKPKAILKQIVNINCEIEKPKKTRVVCMCPQWRGQTTFIGDFFTCPTCGGEACI